MRFISYTGPTDNEIPYREDFHVRPWVFWFEYCPMQRPISVHIIDFIKKLAGQFLSICQANDQTFSRTIRLSADIKCLAIRITRFCRYI